MSKQLPVPNFEIAQVVGGQVLLDGTLYPHREEASQGTTLHPGFYVVVWPMHSDSSDYNAGAGLFGPFASRLEAFTVLKRSIDDYFGISNETFH